MFKIQWRSDLWSCSIAENMSWPHHAASFSGIIFRLNYCLSMIYNYVNSCLSWVHILHVLLYISKQQWDREEQMHTDTPSSSADKKYVGLVCLWSIAHSCWSQLTYDSIVKSFVHQCREMWSWCIHTCSCEETPCSVTTLTVPQHWLFWQKCSACNSYRYLILLFYTILIL